MSKRKKTSEHDAGGVVNAPVEGDRTSPDLSGPQAIDQGAASDESGSFDEPDPDTQVGPPPGAAESVVSPEESWDGPTNVGSEDELAELAAASITHVDHPAPAELGAEEPPAEPGESVGGEASGDAAEGAEAGVEPPPVAAPGRLASIIESLLFASDRSLTVAELKRLCGEREGAKINAALEELRARRADTGVNLVQVAGGWHLRTNPENVAWVSRILAGKPPRLSRAMLETLAIVAYRQPITRPEIDEIRGVDCGPVLKTLLERNLIRMIGKKEEVGRPILYGTTPEFLRTFSLRDLTELPTLREFHELGEAEKAKVDAAAPPPEAAEAPAAPPPKPVLREPDPEEEDALLSELDRANAAATKATAPPPEATPEATPPADAVGVTHGGVTDVGVTDVGVTDDKTVG
ncbi:MAG TPA: SMC-Scp complex subunit ScpB [Polyangia bacterium]|nr:SMC-Scp complex subunit ScpB [Polyangia bacterium]